MTLEERYDFLVDYIGITEEEIGVAIHFNGNNEETYNELLYYTTGWRSIEQYIECEMEEDD